MKNKRKRKCVRCPDCLDCMKQLHSFNEDLLYLSKEIVWFWGNDFCFLQWVQELSDLVADSPFPQPFPQSQDDLISRWRILCMISIRPSVLCRRSDYNTDRTTGMCLCPGLKYLSHRFQKLSDQHYGSFIAALLGHLCIWSFFKLFPSTFLLKSMLLILNLCF